MAGNLLLNDEMPTEKELKRVFRKYDKDNSKTIDVDEMMAMLKELGQNPTRTEVKGLVREVDTNRTGVVEFAEFKQLFIRYWRKAAKKREELLEAFSLYDKDCSGMISEDEIRKIMSKPVEGLPLNEEEVDEMVKGIMEADVDKDGQITYKEFANMLCSYWPS